MAPRASLVYTTINRKRGNRTEGERSSGGHLERDSSDHQDIGKCGLPPWGQSPGHSGISTVHNTGYRIKLYGHTSEDPELFRKNLAAMLGKSEEEARELLLAAPVTIVEGVSQERAETLIEVLKSLQALCLVEAMEDQEGEASADSSTSESAAAPKSLSISTLLAEREPLLEPEQKEELKSHFWLGVTCAIGATIVLICLVGYILSFRDINSMFGADAHQAVVSPKEVNPGADQPAEDRSEEIAFVTREVERLKSNQERLEFEIADQQGVANQLGATGGKHWERWRVARARLAMLRNEHREASNQLKELEQRLRQLRRH